MTSPAPASSWPLLSLLRFWLGLNVILLGLTLLSRAFTPGADPLTPAGVVLCLLMTALGFALGLTYARYWPLPDSSFPRLIRMALLAIPAVGLSLALSLLLRPDITALVLALAAFLGAQWRFGMSGSPVPSEPASRQAARSKR
ncbi:hypothetical protein [Deinococcus arenicola]|uniref:Uncharacterized protein n=1 Tax=Deinococcus arenicola TaxID=2994950 RepID=A0ABU4DNQ2_9DEIO|nr:hypothetical protein [Deinococcus sp. ZS9-10]MDV6373520.1 hypothetical protein [Deinococcus sp. ZS9-10]